MTPEDIIKEIINNKIRFIKYNDIRLKKFREYAEVQGVADLIEAIPFLICSNNAGLPGYMQGFEPIGIYNYKVSANALRFINRYFPGAQAGMFKNPMPMIDLFAIMGSAGSIAYNEESDIDYWICLDESRIDPAVLNNLKNKLRSIEFWITENYNIETHFFINDTSRVRNNVFDSDEDDISGKALGKLLKDEFLRSSILLFGKTPFWWVVPPGISDKNYQDCYGIVMASEYSDQFIDFGNLNIINKDEFLGAGLFQILKSLGNPFKSILKIGILEKYLNEENRAVLLCNILKEHIQKEDYDVNYIDPYVLMFNEVLKYYTEHVKDDPFAQEILKRCFYIKINPMLSLLEDAENNKYITERQKLLLDYSKKWGWLGEKIKQIDGFRNWELGTLNKFWNSIRKLILKTYKKILDKIEIDNTSEKFSSKEFTYISRRIYSSFSAGGNKIKPAISFNDNPIEKFLYIESLVMEDKSIVWLLSKGMISGSGSSRRSIIHKEPSLLAMLAWISVNRLFQKNDTRVEIKSRYQLLENNYVRELLNELTLYFSLKRINIKNKYFFSDPFPILSFIIINLNVKYLDDIKEIYYLYHNSWGETIYERYDKEIDFALIMTKYLNGALEYRETFENSVYMTSPKPNKSFKELFRLQKEIYDYFITDTAEEQDNRIIRKYITKMGGNFVIFSSQGTGKERKIVNNIFDTELKMLYSLSGTLGVKNSIRINSTDQDLNHIRIILENYKEDAVQIYFQKARKYCYFFISDERGSVIFFRKDADNFVDYLARLIQFTKNVITQIKKINPESPFNQKNSRQLEVYRLNRTDLNTCSVKEFDYERDKEIIKHKNSIIPLKLSIILLDNGETGYRFSLPDSGISDNLSKDEVSGISGEMRTLMETVRGYNYFVTDINLSSMELKVYKDFSTFSFIEKNRFELFIEKGLSAGEKIKVV